MKTYRSIKTLFFCFIAQIHQHEVYILRSSCLCSSINGSTNHQKSMLHPSIPLYSTRKKERITKKLTNKTAMLHRRQRSPKMRLYSTSMYFPSRRYHHLHLPRLSLFLFRSRKRKRRSSNRKLNPSSYLFRFCFYSSNKKTMLHQQIRSTDLRGKSYVYDTRGWDGGLCLIEWMDGWMDGATLRENGIKMRKWREKRGREKRGKGKGSF